MFNVKYVMLIAWPEMVQKLILTGANGMPFRKMVLHPDRKSTPHPVVDPVWLKTAWRKSIW
jgi:hypothetical protein